MANQTYLNFDLSLSRVGDKYHAEVTDSPAGQAACDFKLPFAEAEIAHFQPVLAAYRRHLLLVEPTTSAATPLRVQEFGERLFAATFGNDLDTALLRSLDAAARQGAGLRIRLRMDDSVPELAELPWEYLYVPSLKRFPALSTQLSIVRYVKLNQPEQPLTVMLPLHVLVIIAAPQDAVQLDVEQEWLRIQQATAALQEQGLLRLERLEKATMAALRKRLRATPIHILHFIGHGFFDPEQELGGLVFTDDNGRSQVVSADMLATRLHDHQTLRLVLLNACEGARSAQDCFFAGVAQKLVQQGAPAVIAMQFPISDAAAILLAQEFYQTLVLGYPVDAALDEARKAIYEQNTHRDEWGAPVLFMRAPNGLLFDTGLLPKPASEVEVMPVPPPASTWRRRLPAAGIGVLVSLLIFLISRTFNTPVPAALPTTPLPVTALSSLMPTATLVPPVAVYEWPSPTPALPTRIGIAVAAFADCAAPLDLYPALQNSLKRQLEDSDVTVQIEHVVAPVDTTAITPDTHILLWGRCRDDGQIELQMLLNGLPPVWDALLFEPRQLRFIIQDSIYAQQVALATTLYALTRYETAANAFRMVPTPVSNAEGAGDQFWLAANLAAHHEQWREAATKFSAALTASTIVTDIRAIMLTANLGLAQRMVQAGLSDCTQDAYATYTKAITLAERIALSADQVAMLHVGRGFALDDCPNTDDTSTLYAAVESDAQIGIQAGLAYGDALQAMLDSFRHKHLQSQFHACRALAADPTLPIPHLALAIVYGRFTNLQSESQEHFAQYGALARFESQRTNARELISVSFDEGVIAPPEIEQCD